MNEDTLVAVCGYAGDASQIEMLMPQFLHHQCPVLVLSPVDSPITPGMVGEHVGVSYHAAGLRAYDTPPAVARFRLHLERMLKEPANFFFINDSDSICLSPELPKYLYEEPDVLWSSIIHDLMHDRPIDCLWPRIAFHPPWFFSRAVGEKLVEVWDTFPLDPQTPLIDNHLMHLAVLHHIRYKPFISSASLPTHHPYYQGLMSEAIRKAGRLFIHTVKTKEARDRFLEDYKSTL